MLEMAVGYNLGCCFWIGAPKEAQSRKWPLSPDQYPWERDKGCFIAPLVSLCRSFPGPLMLQTGNARGKPRPMPCSVFTNWPRSQECLLLTDWTGGNPVMIPITRKFTLSLFFMFFFFPGDVHWLYSSTKDCNILFTELAWIQRQCICFAKRKMSKTCWVFQKITKLWIP